ncbi:type II secretion system protein N [Aquabacterium lacunae]|jgi:general secretion pathway protein N|nr:type II secretion system protein N [Aquabacterium lacunae]
MGLLALFRRSGDWMPKGFDVTTRWLESTLEVARWEHMRRAGRRWGWWGGALGGLVGVSLFAPASWLASAVSAATQQRFILAEAEGTVWSGSAVMVLTGGSGSRDARALPGRTFWTLRPKGLALAMNLSQDCCMQAPVTLLLQPGWAQLTATVQTSDTAGLGRVGEWPAAWLGGLGTPFNTLQLGGVMNLSAQGVQWRWAKGRMALQGQVQLTLSHVSSRVTTLPELGSYRLSLIGQGDGPMNLLMQTDQGALQLSGAGAVGAFGVRFRGEATATAADRPALNNLLNIIGRRTGDRSVISIG